MTKTKGTVENTPRLDAEDLKPGKGWELVTIHNAQGRCLDSFVDEEEDGGMVALLNSVWGDPDGPIWRYKLKTTTDLFPRLRYVCPKCGKPRRFLYFDGKEDVFSCRWCCNLNYRVQQKRKDCVEYYYDALEYAKTYLKGWTPPPGSVPADFPHMVPEKPPGMSKQYYEKVLKRFRHYQKQYKDAAGDELYQIMGKKMGLTREQFRAMGGIF